MENRNEIFISFYYNKREIIGIDGFKKELDEHYICQGRDADIPAFSEGGELWFDIFLNIEFTDFIKNIIIGGVAWDIIKKGTKKYFLRPLLNALKNLENENKEAWGIRIQTMKFIFDDIEIVIGGIRPNRFSVVSMVFNEIAKRKARIEDEIKFPIKKILTPILYNKSSDGNIVGPYYLNTDTELDINDYLDVWKISYFRGSNVIYRLADKSIIEIPYNE